MKILLCSNSATLAVNLLASQLLDDQIITCSPDTVIEHLDGVDVVIPYTPAVTIDASIINSGKFGLVQQFGVGLETVDIEAATDAGVWVARVPGSVSSSADAVAEHAIMLMLMLSRRIKIPQHIFNAEDSSQKIGTMLLNKTACIVGLGDIGTALAVRLKAFGMRILGVRKHPKYGTPLEAKIEKVYGSDALYEALSSADYVILCAEYSKSTHHLINQNTLAVMKPGAFIINVARGSLVDTTALEVALEKGHLAGAGLDVVDSPTSSLYQHNVVITPHIAGMTDVSYQNNTFIVIENIKRYARGKKPLYTVNTPQKI